VISKRVNSSYEFIIERTKLSFCLNPIGYTLMKKAAFPMVAEALEDTTPETLALIAVEILF
jgi:hypothetical protein